MAKDLYMHLTGMHAGSWLLIAMAVLVIIISAATIAERADARASILNNLAECPNGFEPGGHDEIGTAASMVVDVLGWNATRVMGNLGIGDGSLSFLNATSNRTVKYPDHDIMGGDVSDAPLEARQPRQVKTTEQPATLINRTGSSPGRQIANTSGSQVDNSTVLYPAGSGNEYDSYHPIQIGEPIDDLLYEHPLSTPGLTYCRLIGVRMPSGDLVNVGIKCSGYGF